MKTSYYWNGNSLSGVQTGSDVLYFYYGSDQKLEGFSLNGTNYLYLRDAIGTINGILDADGHLVAQYVYDAWGNILSILDGAGVDVSSNAAHIANVNPFCYRGYFYDADTGFYYLQSRYYDPVVGRFLNADDAGILGLVGAISEVEGNLLVGNLYTYCFNNPVMNVDPNGYLTISPFRIRSGYLRIFVRLTDDDIRKIKFSITAFMVVFDAACAIVGIVGGIPSLGISTVAAAIAGVVVSTISGLGLAYIDYMDRGKGVSITFNIRYGLRANYYIWWKTNRWGIRYPTIRSYKTPYAYLSTIPLITWYR